MTRRPSARAGRYVTNLGRHVPRATVEGMVELARGRLLDAHTISILGQAGRLAARKAQSPDPSKRVPVESAWDGVRPVLLANKPMTAAQELQARMVFVTAYNMASGGGV